jgi:type II secretory pathway component PulJ
MDVIGIIIATVIVAILLIVVGMVLYHTFRENRRTYDLPDRMRGGDNE